MAIDIDKLMSGVCIVIDDAFRDDKDKKDDIFKIVEQIEDKNIPLVKYADLPDDAVPHFKNVSFILLDWDLNQIVSSAEEPVTIPSGLETSNVVQNIEFIKNIKKTCFIPLFIFTKENVDEVINDLTDAGLYAREKHNFIFVKSKSEIKTKGSLFLKINNWLKETSSIYVLKEWELSLNCAKNELFWDFYDINPDWPKVLWKAYKADSVNMSNELGGFISKNLLSRISSFNFDPKLLVKNVKDISREDFRKVLEGERFIAGKYINKDEIHTGDMYKKNSKYYLNIRPQCDCIPRDNEKIDAIELYCLEGSKMTDTDVDKFFDKDFGMFREKDNNCIIFPVDTGKAIDFRFKKLKKFQYNDLKDRRLGRLILPYITKVQQKYSNYLHRPGLSRIPIEVIKENNN